ncbi:sugar MFS transporter [Polluticoccus soli]|uniref:sugar MFS transporter n=1 Tax=Polluticoccus soli TaxID=3034150 RepID=UPI0023E12E58|nr:sugar MFS transporter [Flavipsychrobacter sp. JY13-12]
MKSNTKQSYTTSLFLVGCLFFIFGFVTWLNGTLIPFLKAACELNNFQSYFVTFAFFISYFVMALPSSAILRATGFKKGMSLGLFVMAIGTVIFIPAAMQRSFTFFLIGLFTQGLGLSILQTATNPYVTILGSEESAARRISIMGIANKVAGILSPLILATILLGDIDTVKTKLASAADVAAKSQLLDDLARRIINPYIVLTIALVVLALLVLISPLPDIDDEEENPDIKADSRTTSIFQHPYLFFGVFAIFLYVGVEVIAGDSIISYGTYLGIPINEAKFFTSFTLGCMIAGYFLGILLTPNFISQETALKVCAVLGILFTIGVLTSDGRFSVYCLAALGLAHSIMWPAIWPMSLKGLGRFTKTGAALLIMGIAGGAVLPLLYGHLADLQNNQAAYWILIPCYLYILYFAIWGHKVGYKK